MKVLGSLRQIIAPLLAIGLSIILFIVIYAPAFAAVAGFKVSLNQSVPVIILITLTVACVLICLLARLSRLSLARFGFRWSGARWWVYAMALAMPLSALAAWGLSRVGEPGPLAGLNLAPWLVWLYFVVGAPIQEEVIFRGLLQTVFAKALAFEPRYAAASDLVASLTIGLLFGAIHLIVGPLTALAGLVLGLLAGELRRRAGSLAPAILCHAIFNLGGILWALS